MTVFASDDTIVAIATPPGRGGIGVVRLSGPAAGAIAAAMTARPGFPPRHATLARVVDPAAADGSAGPSTFIDEVLVTWFPHPHSYTGEDVVEVSGHGSPPVQTRIVELAMQAGARLAEPGEFTLRAYLNGRMDLVQAEAVADLIEAVTPLQVRAAMDQLEGTLTARIAGLDADLLDLTARLEASLDFPEEGFHFATPAELRADLTVIRQALDRLSEEGRAGRVVREGRLVVIAGPPNAGKSSLFNALVGAPRAIVTDVPGTTRDAVTERVDVSGLPITLVDTAGLCETTDPVEREGVARTRQAQAIAALTLLVLDQAAPLGADARGLISQSPAPQLIVLNKADEPAAWQPSDHGLPADPLVVSARTGMGLGALRARLARELAGREEWRDLPAISNIRHLGLVDEARAALGRADAGLAAGATEELVAADVTEARHALEAITGRRTSDDVLRHIFSRFCIGK